MYNVEIESRGRVYDITSISKWEVERVDGVTSVEGETITSRQATQYGEMFSKATIGKRVITIQLALKQPLVEARRMLYKIFPLTEKIRFYYSLPDLRVYIDGYVRIPDFSLHDNPQKAFVYIDCPEPFFINAKKIKGNCTSTKSFAIDNDGVRTGAIFTLTINSNMYNPAIINTSTGKSFVVEGLHQAGDVITINSNDGSKNVTLTRGGTTKNWLSNASDDSIRNFLYIEPGDNIFLTSDNSITAEIKTSLKYQGV